MLFAAGSIDCFNDALFKRVLRRILRLMEPGGELVIGNFSPNHPNIASPRVVEWHLPHRSEDRLRALAIESGVPPNRIRIGPGTRRCEPISSYLELWVTPSMLEITQSS